MKFEYFCMNRKFEPHFLSPKICLSNPALCYPKVIKNLTIAANAHCMVKKDGEELPGSEPISFPITIMVVAYLLQLTQSATTSTELGMFHLTRLEPLKTIQI